MTLEIAKTLQVIQVHKSCDRIAARNCFSLLLSVRNQPNQLKKEDVDNMLGSMTHLAEQPDEEAATLLLDYLEALAPYLRLRGRDSELLQWCEVGLQACKRVQRNLTQVLLLRGEAQYALGRWEQAATSWQRALKAGQAEGPARHAQALLALGQLQLNQGKYRMALRTLDRAERLFKSFDDLEGMIAVRSEMAAYRLNRRENDRAYTMYREIDQLQKTLGAGESSDNTLLMLGVVSRRRGAHKMAIDYLLNLYQRQEAQSNVAGMATAAHHLAWVYLDLNKLNEARRLCGQALAFYDDVQDPRGLSDAYEQLGMICLQEGNLAAALENLERSVRMRRNLGNQHGLASCLRRLAVAHLRSGHYLRALLYLTRGLFIYLQMGMLSRQRIAGLTHDFVSGFREDFD